MPTQALIRRLSIAEVQERLGDVLEAAPIEGTVLVWCKTDDEGVNVAGAASALQQICDADAETIKEK